MLTDSGGFQVFSLGEKGAGRAAGGPGLVEIAEEGVTFRSHLDGSRHLLSPERAIEVQEALGADVIMAFDECPPSLADRAYHELSLARTQRWLVRCRAAWRELEAARGPLRALRHRPGRPLPGPQGARHRGGVRALDLPGYALGGYAVGETPEADVTRGSPATRRCCRATSRATSWAWARPVDLSPAGIAPASTCSTASCPPAPPATACSSPAEGKVVIRNAGTPTTQRPVDPDCACYTCRTFSRAYLRHLFEARRDPGAARSTPCTTCTSSCRSWRRRAGPSRRGTFAAFRAERLGSWREEERA